MVRSVASGRKFYRLPPDEENTVGRVNSLYFAIGITTSATKFLTKFSNKQF